MKTIIVLCIGLISFGCTKNISNKLTTYKQYSISYDTVFYGSGLDTGSNMGVDTGSNPPPAFWNYSNSWTFSVSEFDCTGGGILDSIEIVTYTTLKASNFIGPAGVTRRDTLSSASQIFITGYYQPGAMSASLNDKNVLMNAVEAFYSRDSSMSNFIGKGSIQFRYSATTEFMNPVHQAGDVTGIVPVDSTAISITYFYKKPS